MLDWLKSILGDAYTDDIDKKVSEEIGRAFVAKADFNNVKTELKAAKETITDRDNRLEVLKSSSGDVESLKAQIATLQTENTTAAQAHEAEIKRLKINNAVETALVGAKAKNIKAVMALLDLDKAELAEDGGVKGLNEQIKALTESHDTNFLFDLSSNKGGSFKGLNPAEGRDGGTGSGGKMPQDMTYSELCAYLDSNPDAKL